MIDIRTLSLASGSVALFTCIPFIVLAMAHRALPGVRQWALAFLAAFLGLFLVSFRNELPAFFTVIVGNSLILLSSLLVVRGMKAFLGQPQSNWPDALSIIIPAVALQAFLWPWPDTAARIAIFSLATAFLMARCFSIAWAAFPRVLPGRDPVLLVTCAAYSAWHLTRAILALLFVRPAADLMTSGIYQGMSFLFGIGSIIMIATSLMIATIRKLEGELSGAKEEVQTLSGLLPICSSCKMIRSDDGTWSSVESYISTRSDLSFSHGLCPDCMKKLYPELVGRV